MRGILFSALAIGIAALPIDTITAALVNGDRNRVWNDTSNTLIDRPFRSERGLNKDEAWLYEVRPPLKYNMHLTVGFGGVHQRLPEKGKRTTCYTCKHTVTDHLPRTRPEPMCSSVAISLFLLTTLQRMILGCRQREGITCSRCLCCTQFCAHVPTVQSPCVSIRTAFSIAAVVVSIGVAFF